MTFCETIFFYSPVKKHAYHGKGLLPVRLVRIFGIILLSCSLNILSSLANSANYFDPNTALIFLAKVFVVNGFKTKAFSLKATS